MRDMHVKLWTCVCARRFLTVPRCFAHHVTQTPIVPNLAPCCSFIDVRCNRWCAYCSILQTVKRNSSFLVTPSQPLSLFFTQGNFGGHCMLYGAVSYNATSKLIGVQSSTSSSLCYFVSAISIMVAVVCFSLSVYWVYTFCSEGELKRWPHAVCVFFTTKYRVAVFVWV